MGYNRNDWILFSGYDLENSELVEDKYEDFKMKV